MTFDHLIKNLSNIIKKWLDNKPTGSLSLELHARKGGITKVYRGGKEEVIHDETLLNKD